jgi:hypothetical protein
MHTPGPWKGYKHTGYVYGPGVVVCVCGDFLDKELLPFNRERWAADTLLIAAAPDLLQSAEQIIDSMGSNDQPPSLSALEALRAAYKKATGRDVPA